MDYLRNFDELEKISFHGTSHTNCFQIVFLNYFFQSWDLYADTIIEPLTESTSPLFYGVKCKNSAEYSSGLCCQYPNLETARMGEYVNETTRGLFYLTTNPKRPYAKATIEESTGCQWVVKPD